MQKKAPVPELGIEDPFRQLVDSTRDYAIFLLDRGGHILTWNAGAERIKGYAAPEILGHHFSRFYPAEALAQRWPEHELAVAAAQGRFEDEGWRLRKDGSRFWANVIITALRDAEGEVRGFAKITRDLSERQRAEAKLIAKVEQRYDEFLAMLAHELRNPLAPMASALKLLARAPTSDPTELWVREVLERQTGQMSRLVDDLLDVSRVTRAAMVLDRKPLDARRSLRNALDAARQWIEEGRHRLRLTIAEERLEVDGDEVRLNQVFQNLLHNAAKYTPEGGEIHVAARREDGEAVISVRDNGVGMTAELVASAFEMFKQGSQSLDRPHGGLGVGLTLVQRLVQLHGGSVEARSEGPGKGAEFVVRLPLRTEPAIVDAESISIRTVSGAEPPAPRRVLVVDDNRDAAHALRLLLQTDGHEVMVAADGAAGLALARQQRPDVVLLDIGLPILNGYEIATQIRADPALKGTMLVAVTGYGQMHDRARASASGFDHHLVKPV
ncbi:MAG: hybrid sensor histidine kinase/response regulator, partial [Betaproteobacteria bacterium]